MPAPRGDAKLDGGRRPLSRVHERLAGKEGVILAVDAEGGRRNSLEILFRAHAIVVVGRVREPV